MTKFKAGEKVICVNALNITSNALTIDKVYTIIKEDEDEDDMVWIINDKDDIDFFMDSRFISVIENRFEIINDILK